ncbi:hypothetical protein AB205_0201270 [Aquarana catesbeiana]|uniref:Uncharacterized protein n=1 Tax=Aquarana catesbeiana TaxID=8400 RepID=A0A2G9S064_AQUCT|nr:hypothetical protein AB205_0201270 [Aquarana catesbeiana]
MGEKRLGTSEDTRDPPTPERKENPHTTTRRCVVDVVEEDSHFTSASAHVLIGEIMVCNQDLQKIKEDINDIEKRLKNIMFLAESKKHLKS